MDIKRSRQNAKWNRTYCIYEQLPVYKCVKCMLNLPMTVFLLYLDYFCSCFLQNICNPTPRLHHFIRHSWTVILLRNSNSYPTDVYILTQIQWNEIVLHCSRVQWIVASENIWQKFIKYKQSVKGSEGGILHLDLLGFCALTVIYYSKTWHSGNWICFCHRVERHIGFLYWTQMSRCFPTSSPDRNRSSFQSTELYSEYQRQMQPQKPVILCSVILWHKH